MRRGLSGRRRFPWQGQLQPRQWIQGHNKSPSNTFCPSTPRTHVSIPDERRLLYITWVLCGLFHPQHFILLAFYSILYCTLTKSPDLVRHAGICTGLLSQRKLPPILFNQPRCTHLFPRGALNPDEKMPTRPAFYTLTRTDAAAQRINGHGFLIRDFIRAYTKL